MSNKQFTIVAAVGPGNEIGENGSLPWSLPEDLRHFRQVTQGGTLIMGRGTWESIGSKPLAGRKHIVVSSTMQEEEECRIVRSFGEALDVGSEDASGKLFVIGGQSIFVEAIKSLFCTRIIITNIRGPSKYPAADRFFPRVPLEHYYLCSETDPQTSKSGLVWTVAEYQPINMEEHQVLFKLHNLLREPMMQNRTGITTRSKFGMTLRYSLRNGEIPLMTTRKMFVRGIFLELMWVLRGDTSAKRLADSGCKIWLPNSTREFLDERNLQHLETGDVGETYGFLMRHFGARYHGCNHNHTGQGFDQLANLIDGLRSDPNSRRHVVSLWNPASQSNCALPPCLFCYTFMFSADGRLNLHIEQRSSDFFLARSWNDTFAAMFLHLVCKMVGADPGELYVTITNAHMYVDHTMQALEQLSRKPLEWPLFKCNKEIRSIDDLTSLEWKTDVSVVGYKAWPRIKAEMAV